MATEQKAKLIKKDNSYYLVFLNEDEVMQFLQNFSKEGEYPFQCLGMVDFDGYMNALKLN